ncbi:MAG TPA: hypothetical protein VFP58_06150 [Candidatus Eisenbacteria bacterium]|nr:hypothetical protein [Candidatus Eisenbacteria bacterium]
MARLLVVALGSVFLSLPCQAATMLELGTAPHVSVHVEGKRGSVGLGLSASYREDTYPSSLGAEEVRIWTFSPFAIARLFLSDGTTRSFLEVRASREISSVSGETPEFFSPGYEELYDNWTTSLGAGLRAGINDRLRIGGAVDAWAKFYTFSDREDSIHGGTAFRVFLDYVL